MLLIGWNVSMANDCLLRRQGRGSCDAARRAGPPYFQYDQSFLFSQSDDVPFPFIGTLLSGLTKGKLERREGIMTIECWGKTMAWCLKKIAC